MVAATMERPWRALYTKSELAADFTPGTLVELFQSALVEEPSAPALNYFDAAISFAELDMMSDALAEDIVRNGFNPGDRLGVYMQNIPQFVIACLGTWKAGGIAVSMSPMSRAVELGKLLPDCTPSVIIAQNELLPHVIEAVAAIPGYVPRLIATSAREFQTLDDGRVLPPAAATSSHPDLLEIIQRAASSAPMSPVQVGPGDTAMLVYTSGTTGQPKGAMLSHANITHNAEAVVCWYGLKRGMGPVLVLAPLFHVSGLMHLAFAWALAEPMVLTYRFHPEVVLETVIERRPSFTVAAITAFIALLNTPGVSPRHFESFRVILSGGAPIPPSVVDAFEEKTGRYLHNGYGLTETSAGVVAVPFQERAPVDPVSGTLSIGVPKYGVDLWIAGEGDERLPPGAVGEIVVSGAAVSAGYWNKPSETAEAMRADGFRTGDVGFMDSAGWVFLVDRKKDMISASGFKVWPREVEDVLYSHPSVREAGVTGVADAYRGETVRAIISLKAGTSLQPDELIAWCRERMAPYKVPREVLIIEELPKTASGKILRRHLRDLDL